MSVNLNYLTASQIALVAIAASVFAAIVGAVTAFVVATVNAHAAAKLVRESARRTYELATINPFLDTLEQHIAHYQELIDEGPRLSASLRKADVLVGSTQVPELQSAIKEFEANGQRLNDLVSKMRASRAVYKRIGWFAFVVSDRRVIDRLTEWVNANHAFTEAFRAGGFTGDPEKLQHMSKRASEAHDKAVYLRLAIEDFVFRKRGWLHNGLYSLWSKWSKWKANESTITTTTE
jgi:hypothetical protein